jgi:hypothetical protein
MQPEAQNYGSYQTGEETNFVALNVDGKRETSIYINKTTIVGTKTYWIERSTVTGELNLHIEFDLFDNWKLRETYMATSLEKDFPHDKNGYIDHTQFPVYQYLEPPLSNYKMELPLGDLPARTEGIYHAEVSNFELYNNGSLKGTGTNGPCVFYVPY